jgi:hypothetical protein
LPFWINKDNSKIAWLEGKGCNISSIVVCVQYYTAEEKTIASFRVLPFLLPMPPKRGIKKQRLSSAAAAEMLYSDIQVHAWFSILANVA